ncbi:MAG: CPBP family intramembrane metalloprotease [Lachnospiraceae bacterium]|nr:CPBP family intramembrane metalloprotease [Lachnospiraceae bacterium]
MTKDKDIIKRIVIFLASLFAVTYTYEFAILYPQWKVVGSIGALNTAAVMLFPALCVLLTRTVTKEGFNDCMLNPNFVKGKIRYYVGAWVFPPLFAILGALIYFMIFRSEFSPDLEYYVGVLSKQGAAVSVSGLRTALIGSVFSGLVFSPILNVVTCFGEEWGWRAYLQPRLSKLLGPIPAVFVTGAVWGLWHLPLTIMGHNYGLGYPGYPVTGIISMCIFCVILGISFAYITFRTGSVWPAVIAHGSVNGFASIGIYFTKNGGNPFVGPSVTGIIGGIPLIIMAVFALVRLLKDTGEVPEVIEARPLIPDGAFRTQIREAQMPMPEVKDETAVDASDASEGKNNGQ